MAHYGTVLGQGTFVVPSTVVNQVIVIHFDRDWETPILIVTGKHLRRS